jgi:2-methylfumaryl-CoA isomerase
VAELSAFVAAPLGGMTLAQMGADVIQISPISGRMDSHRWPRTDSGQSLYWASLNKGKRSILVDLKRPEGQELAASLACGCSGDGGGIVLTNLPARGALSAAALRARRADLIHLTLSGNPDGATAIDYTINCASGLPYMTGDGSAPVNHSLPTWDVAAGLYLATGVLAAERHRRLSGQGQDITLTLADVMLATLGNLGFLPEAEVNTVDRPAQGNQVYGAFGRDFATADQRRVMVAAISDKQWNALCAATDSTAAMAALQQRVNADLGDEVGRYHARDAIAALLAPWFLARSLDQIAAAFAGTGVLWGPFQTLRQLLAEDRRCSLDNPLFDRINQPGIGPHLAPHVPLAFGGLPRGAVPPAPRLGEHSEAILADVLRLPAHAIGHLFDAGLVASTTQSSLGDRA